MASFLSALLGAREPLFSMTMTQLEEVTARQGVDARLVAEIIGKIHTTTALMGLDPKDTSGLELYHALINKARNHDAHLAAVIGVAKLHDVESTLPRIKHAIDNLAMPRTVWVLKNSVAKRLLKQMPPKKIMKHLGYSSVDSLIKRERMSEIYGALRFAESPAWQKTFTAQYRELRPADFETRNLEIVIMPKQRWAQLAESYVRQNGHTISHLKELGIVLLLPMTIEYWQGITITALPLALHYVNEVRMYSAYIKLQQTKQHFGLIVTKVIAEDYSHPISLHYNKIHWRIVQRHFAGKTEKHPHMFEPHVQPEDLLWRKAEEYVYMVDPELGFWRDMDYVGAMHGSRPISFNLVDMAQMYAMAVPYRQRIVRRLHEAVWNEIYVRYLQERIIEEQVLQQLDNTIKDRELLKA